MIELQIVQYLNHFGLGTIVDKITILVSNYYFLAALILVVIGLVVIFDKKALNWVLFALIFAFVLDLIIVEGLFKNFLLNFIPLRSRPFVAYPTEIVQLGVRYYDSAFPSGHVAGTVAALTPLVYRYRKLAAFAFIFMVLMSFARVHNGMHYPSDVLMAIFIGIISGVVAIGLANHFQKSSLEK